MSQDGKQSLIDEIDSRQNELLDRLAELNSRVESLLNDCLKARDAELAEQAEAEESAETPIAKPHAPMTTHTPESETV